MIHTNNDEALILRLGCLCFHLNNYALKKKSYLKTMAVCVRFHFTSTFANYCSLE